jgi:hypothetical protein
MTNGQQISVGFEDQTVRGRVALVSGNEKSLMVELESGLRVGAGFYLDFLPLLRNDAGEYEDLLQGRTVRVSTEELEG